MPTDNTRQTIDYAAMPDERGHFGIYGGRFVSETLMQALDELRDAYQKFSKDKDFQAQFDADLAYFVGRPSPLYHAERLSKETGGAQIFLKRVVIDKRPLFVFAHHINVLGINLFNRTCTLHLDAFP